MLCCHISSVPDRVCRNIDEKDVYLVQIPLLSVVKCPPQFMFFRIVSGGSHAQQGVPFCTDSGCCIGQWMFRLAN